MPLLLLGLALLLVVVAVLCSLCGVLLVAARGRPGGRWRDVAAALPACAVTARRLARHPDVPLRAKLVVGAAALWVLSPVDLVPEFLPVIGQVDDVLVAVFALRWAARRVPRQVIEETWPGDRALLARLLR